LGWGYEFGQKRMRHCGERGVGSVSFQLRRGGEKWLKRQGKGRELDDGGCEKEIISGGRNQGKEVPMLKR